MSKDEAETRRQYEELFGKDSLTAELHTPGPGKVKVHVDFTILDLSTRTEYYWEHHGKLGDPEYLAGFHRKMRTYNLSGLPKSGHFLSTYESGQCPLNTTEIQSLLSPFTNDRETLQ